MIVFGQIFVSKPILVRFFCIIPVPYRATTLISSIFRRFRPELRKKSFRSYTGGEKGHFDERVFGDFSKTSYPIGIILVP